MQVNNVSKNSMLIKKIVGMALFSALAYGVTFIFRIPVQFLTFDAKDAILTIAGFIYGPVAAIIMSAIPALIEFITISSTGPWGLLMNFASSACFACTASLVYKFRRSFDGAIIAIYSAVLVTTLFMIPMNILITPVFLEAPRAMVVEKIPTLLLPFNFAKSLMNAAIVLFIYKPVSVALKRAGFITGNVNIGFNKRSVITLVVGGVTMIAAIVIFIILNLGIL